MKDITNVLTVLYAKPSEKKKKMFFCPYTKNITTNYVGTVKAILPGYDPDEDEPQTMIRPQRMAYDMDIQYTFKIAGDTGNTVDFWIQDQYFMKDVIRTYHCYNCQAPNLYYAGNKTVMFNNKSDVKKGQAFNCINPLCKENFTYHGIVKITEVTDQLS